MLYADPDALDLKEILNVTDRPLNSLLEEALCPGNKILDSMDLQYKNRSLNSILENNTLNHDKLIKKTGILFKKVEDDN